MAQSVDETNETPVIELKSARAHARARLLELESCLAIQGVLESCRDEGVIGQIVGGPGTGKTVTAVDFSNRHPNVWMVTASPTLTSVSTLLDAVAGFFGAARHRHRSPEYLFQFIVSEISERLWLHDEGETNGLIIVDEAHFLRDAALETARCLYDTLNSDRRIDDAARVGLVFIGNETFAGRFEGRAAAAAFAALRSRVGARLRLNDPSSADISAIADAYSVKQARARNLLESVASHGGGLRGVARLLERANALAGSAPLRLDHLSAAAKMIGLAP